MYIHLPVVKVYVNSRKQFPPYTFALSRNAVLPFLLVHIGLGVLCLTQRLNKNYLSIGDISSWYQAFYEKIQIENCALQIMSNKVHPQSQLRNKIRPNPIMEAFFFIDQHEPNMHIWKDSFIEQVLPRTILSWLLGVISFCTWEYGFKLILLARCAICLFVSCSIECIIYYENIN